MARLSNRYWISTPCPAPQPQLHGVGGAAGRLLLWSSLSFGLLAANNFIVILDLILLPSIDLLLVRYALSLAAVCLFLFGFIWDLEGRTPMLFPFLSGAITMGCATAGLFFLRFWKRTRGRLFIAFALILFSIWRKNRRKG